nr:MAG TPA: hypothetical protein [Caudoviricetes sp.]
MEYNIIKEGLIKAENKHIKNLVELKKKYDSDVRDFTDAFKDNICDVVKDLDIEELKSLAAECIKDEDVSQGIFLALMVCVAKVGKNHG